MMIDLFLSKPIWGKDNDDSTELRIALFDELEKIIWSLMTSEGRSEARLWLCEAISCLSIISHGEQEDLFLMLLRSKPPKQDLAAQVLQMIFDRRPHKAGLILAKKIHRIDSFVAKLSEESHCFKSWRALFVSSKIGFRKSDAYGLLEHDGISEESEPESSGGTKHKKRRRSRKKRKKDLDHVVFDDDDVLDLDGSDDRFSLPSSSTSWLLSTDGYSASWSLADLPEHISNCLREWMKSTFND